MFSPMLMAVLVVAAPVPDKKDSELIQGRWTFVSIEIDGEKAPAAEFKKAKFGIDGNTITINDGKNDEKATFKLDQDKKPKAIDMKTEKEDKKIAGVYELKGDELKICFAEAGEPRPTEFSTKAGSKRTLIVLKREK